jgi:maltose O-acetyltransferase
MKLLIKIAIQFLIWFKYRNHKFSAEGTGCSYKYLKSTFSYPGKISLANDVHIGPGCNLDGAGGIAIDKGSIIAPEVVIYSRTHNFDQNLSALPFDNVMLTAPVHIGEFVWIGARVIILPGVTIGNGAVVGAGAVISRDVPEGAVVVGNPARVVRYRDKSVFDKLRTEEGAFVYNRYGHTKVFKMKNK